MEIHVDTLFRSDPDGRLLSVNESGDPPAPRFFLGRTPAGHLWRFRYDLPDELAQRLERYCHAEPISRDLTTPPRHSAAIRALLSRHAPVRNEYRGPAYWIPADRPTPAHATLISDSNAQVLQAGFPWLLPLAHESQPIVAIVVQGIAVAVCYCSRRPDRATEAGVETLEAYRGRGHATAAVTGWAAAVRRRGILPLYSASWTNLASQAIARKLGMVPYGEDWSID